MTAEKRIYFTVSMFNLPSVIFQLNIYEDMKWDGVIKNVHDMFTQSLLKI